MGKKITIRADGNIAEAYKEYLLNSLISMGIWRANYADFWEKAAQADGYATTTLQVVNGREYFGGNIFINGVSTPESLKLLEMSGFDETAIQGFRDTQANSKVNAIELIFQPHQTFTLDGLTWFIAQRIRTVLQDSGATQFVLSHTSDVTYTRQSPMIPFSFKTSATALAESSSALVKYMSLSPTAEVDVNEAVELLFRLTSLFENNAVVSTVVTETEVIDVEGGNFWTYTTTTTVTFNDLNFLAITANIESFYAQIHLGDTEDLYYWDSSAGGYADASNFAGYFWKLEYGYSGEYNQFTDNNDMVIYYGGRYWIDKEKFKHAHPDQCVIILGKLLHTYVHIDGGGFFNTFIGSIFKVFIGLVGFLVEIIGEVAFAIFWISGGFLLDMIFTNKDSMKKFKKMYKQISGTVGLMVITIGISTYLQTSAQVANVSAADFVAGGGHVAAGTGGTAVAATMPMVDALFYTAQAVSMGIDAYAILTASPEGAAAAEAQSEDAEKHLAVVYEDSSEMLDAADMFFDGVYEFLDPWADLEV